MFKVALIMVNFVQKDSFVKDESLLLRRFPLKAALLPTQIWEIPGELKISLNLREGNGNNTGRDVHLPPQVCFHQSEYFPSSPLF